MSIKDILLYLDDSSACLRRMDVALYLARSHAASVTGLSILTHDFYQPGKQRANEAMAANEAALHLRALAADVAVSLRSIESTVVGVSASELLICQARCSDLVIVGQESRRPTLASVMVKNLVQGAPCPVLVVPAKGAFPAAGKRVLVAWKNGREAARTLHDALPILRKAEQVTLLAVASGTAAGGVEQAEWDGILQYLSSHGIQARGELQPSTSAPLADTLLNYACEGGFDLLIMGALSGESGRDARLGAVASQILREMTVPVLMSH